MKVACGDTRTDVGEQPALHGVINLAGRPCALFRRDPLGIRINRAQQFWVLREDWIRKFLRVAHWLQPGRRHSWLGEKIVQRNVEPEALGFFGMLLQLHSDLPKKVR